MAEDIPAGPDDEDMLGAVLLSLGISNADVSEVYGPGRFTNSAGRFDLRQGLAFDLRNG